MRLREYIFKSKVEEIAQHKFGFFDNNIEMIPKIVTPDYESLGKLTALRFIEWSQLNPCGVVSLATGKTPKSFINFMTYFLENWHTTEIQNELSEWGLNTKTKPDFSKFILVQMDEYFPIDSSDEKSFFYYINKNYIKNFGFDIKNCLLMNLSNHLKADIDQFALDFESKIQNLGGIGFFLGGIGPEGHIAFNFPGSGHYSRTRLLPINYESAAVASASFGGIEFIRNKLVLTIGLKTITENSTATAIIIADGIGKAKVVQQAIENGPSENYPATALQCLPGASFYLTNSAASLLKTYKYQTFNNTPENIYFWGQKILLDLALEKNKTLNQLSNIDIEQDFLGKLLLNKNIKLQDFTQQTIEILKQKINKGLTNFSGKTFLHTSPHPDDVLLGYLPFINQNFDNMQTTHHFATMTSGANTVQNDYFIFIIDNLEQHLDSILPLKTNQDSDTSSYVSALAQQCNDLKNKALASRTLRNFIKFMKLNSLDSKLIKNKLKDVKSLIKQNIQDDFIINMKSSIREFEEDLVWAHLGFGHASVSHLNLGFYASKDKNINFERDVKPVLNLLNKTKPDIITVALDPEIGGHPTHYKVRQIIAQALTFYDNKNIEVWGYSNIWFKFDPVEANLYLTSTSGDFAVLKTIFNNCYKSQVKAAVPSPEHDGPFSELMQKIIFNQYIAICSCLGNNYFDNNDNRHIVATKGLMFVKAMPVEEFVKL